MTIRSEARLQQSLDEVTRLLDKHRVLETLAEATTEQAGRAFVEVAGVIREWLVEATPHGGLVQLLLTLDPEDLGYVSESIPDGILFDVSRELESADWQAYEESIQYEEEQGAITGTRMSHSAW